ncbi:Mannose-6-phosphate isomerase [Cyphomyrmex costatus]|uniref:Mannose-6-phosphate isomerase n=1 Tax=Cyphomyrmex costatus TaxID=456900 RepID=A0A195CKU6_9HYME|nr:Mannose-6-phosphate isomerase [Cyphomyrmex costatus]
MELKCTVQTYAWGKLGMNSIVASLIKSANADFVVDEQKTYAELWMGTHENGPSYLKDTDIPLHKYIQENTEALGNNVAQTFCSNLPFLFKVLSINKALSIQVHPNKLVLPPGQSSYNLKPRNSASILLIVNGKAKISSKICSRGSVLFIPANDEVEIKVLCDCHPMLMFQAFSNV